MNKHKQYGFTIVELLVVIVVIGILAGVSVSAYSGVQKRAANSAIQTALNATEKAVRLHYASAGSQIKAATPGWYHESLSTMGGACIASSWPTLAELQSILQAPYSEYAARYIYCGVNGGNSSISRDEVQEKLDTAVAASPQRNAFSRIPSFPGVVLNVSGSGSTNVRGIRYAFNDSATTPRSYIFYPLNGKQCLAGDSSVNPNDTVWPSAGGGEWAGPFTTGGDYTTNDTVYCVRTMTY